MNKNLFISCMNLCKNTKNNNILKNINFSLKQGNMMVIIGSSGSGKSTLLHIIAGLDSISSGDIFFNGISIKNMNQDQLSCLRKNNIGFIYQFHYLLFDFSCLENVALPLLIKKEKKSIAYEKSIKMLHQVGLKDNIFHKNPSSLSGGERQRIAIARALVSKPKLIIADEPTGNLDEINSRLVLDLFLKFNKKYNTTVIVVTHHIQIFKVFPIQAEMNQGNLLLKNIIL
ncbi:ABC transporter ATP-binding protein [Buchnera aphidicola (Kurisakia onigurumii)]|uniref:ABC transporter ATP-binding protein n=1 Tax=Buchnera aphidicola TaxID=9 RepID=UPI0031B72E19